MSWSKNDSENSHAPVATALWDCRNAMWSIALFSAAVNILMLAGPLYMLQIYDRVLSSRSVPTLIALTIFLVGAYAFQGILDFIRSRIVIRSASVLDEHLGTTVHAAVVRLAVTLRQAAKATQPLRDLDQIRAFLTSAGPIAIVDLPWMPVFIAICFLIHPWLGFVALAGAVILLVLAILTERASRAPSQTMTHELGLRSAMAEADRRNSESIVAMGMASALANRWTQINKRYLAASGHMSDRVSAFGSMTKVLRLLLQSLILGLGAYLVIQQELTAGAMIAASIMMGRALAPIETAIANWRGFIAARQSIRRLSEILTHVRPSETATELPKPSRNLDVRNLVVAAPGTRAAILRDVHFHVDAGEALGIIGPSGAGKTSLMRTLAGVWPPVRGVVKLDGATLHQWAPENLGRHIGFVSQNIELFDGTVAENIARMTADADSKRILNAARAAGAHEMILRLPAGYDTKIGEAGTVLSAGQRQRIALARALYGDPFLILLDEPHANLDNEGELALNQALISAKARGAVVVIIAHRPTALAVCEKVLLLANGTQQAFGPCDEILKKVLVHSASRAAAAGTNLKVVSETAPGT